MKEGLIRKTALGFMFIIWMLFLSLNCFQVRAGDMQFHYTMVLMDIEKTTLKGTGWDSVFLDLHLQDGTHSELVKELSSWSWMEEKSRAMWRGSVIINVQEEGNLRITEEHYDGREDEFLIEGLSLQFKPLTYTGKDGRVLTCCTLNREREGNAIHTRVWLQESTFVPLALVKQSTAQDPEEHLLALFVQVTPLHDLSPTGGTDPMICSDREPVYTHYVEANLAVRPAADEPLWGSIAWQRLGDLEMGLEVNTALEINLCIKQALFQDIALKLAAEMEALVRDQRYYLKAGISDSTNLWRHLYLDAALYPFIYDLQKREMQSIAWQVGLRWSGDSLGFGFRYEKEERGEVFTSFLSFGKQRKWQISHAMDRENGHSFALGCGYSLPRSIPSL